MIVILKSTRKEEGDVVTTNHALYVCKVLPVNILQHIPPSCALEDPLEFQFHRCYRGYKPEMFSKDERLIALLLDAAAAPCDAKFGLKVVQENRRSKFSQYGIMLLMRFLSRGYVGPTPIPLPPIPLESDFALPGPGDLIRRKTYPVKKS